MKLGLRHLALLVTAFVAMSLNAGALMRRPAGVAQMPQRAALVVRFGDGRVAEQCISFAEPEINGYELLRRSTLPVVANVFGSLGVAICKIGDEGCNYPTEDCFCKAASEQKTWAFWVLQNGTWVPASVGAASTRVTNGTAHGWVWGSESPAQSAKPFDQICNSAYLPMASRQTLQ